MGRLPGSPRACHSTTTSALHWYPFAVHAHVLPHAFALYHTTRSTAGAVSRPRSAPIITSFPLYGREATFPLPTFTSHTFRTEEGDEALGTFILVTQPSIRPHRREPPRDDRG